MLVLVNTEGKIQMTEARIHTRSDTAGRVLIMTAVEAERAAVLRGVGDDPRFVVSLAGVGPASAAALTAALLAKDSYAMVISAGIGGGFSEVATIESIVVATEIIAADLGAETPEGFSSVEELGFGSSRLEVDPAIAQQWVDLLQVATIPACGGPILTVNTATGSEKQACELRKRVPGAAAEAMEGYGVGIAARTFGLPCYEIRSISNAVGPRNREAWRIQEALHSLELAFRTLTEVM